MPDSSPPTDENDPLEPAERPENPSLPPPSAVDPGRLLPARLAALADTARDYARCRTAGIAETQRLGPRFGAGFVRFRVGVPETSRSGIDETRAGVLETGRRETPLGSTLPARALAFS